MRYFSEFSSGSLGENCSPSIQSSGNGTASASPLKQTRKPCLSDMSLEEIAQQIQDVYHRYPHANDEKRIRLLNNLCQQLEKTIRNHKYLARPHSYQFEQLREDIFDEGLQRLFAYLFDHEKERISKFVPGRSPFINWVNFLLRNRFYREATRHLTLPMKVGRDIPENLRHRVNIDDLKELSTDDLSNQSLLDKVISCLDADEDGIYRETYIEEAPEANFRTLCMARLEGDSWEQLSGKFGIRSSTLRSFYTRSLSKFAGRLKECATD